MNQEAEISLVLIVSTAHVKESSLSFLQEYAEDEYGYFVWNHLQEDNNDGEFETPADVRAVLVYAAQHQCAYVRFDRDGPIYKGLETYDW